VLSHPVGFVVLCFCAHLFYVLSSVRDGRFDVRHVSCYVVIMLHFLCFYFVQLSCVIVLRYIVGLKKSRDRSVFLYLSNIRPNRHIFKRSCHIAESQSDLISGKETFLPKYSWVK